MTRSDRITHTLSYIVLLAFAFIVLLPFYFMVITSLKESNAAFYVNPFLPGRPTLANYVDAWTKGKLWRYFLNSVIFSFCSVSGVLIFSITGGYALARTQIKGRNAILLLFLGTLMLPAQITVIPLFKLFARWHMLNTYIGLIIPYVAGGIAFSSFILRGFFLSLPGELGDAGRIDGCTDMGVFFRVMLPLSLPGIATVALFNFIGVWGEFFLALIFISVDSMKPITYGVFSFTEQYQTNWPGLAAGYTIAIVPSILVFLLTQGFFVQGIMAGALKG